MDISLAWEVGKKQTNQEWPKRSVNLIGLIAFFNLFSFEIKHRLPSFKGSFHGAMSQLPSLLNNPLITSPVKTRLFPPFYLGRWGKKLTPFSPTMPLQGFPTPGLGANPLSPTPSLLQ